jgi:glycosyltransferase involved in cell wall biosynthesis
MAAAKPLVSIIIPAYNAAQFLGRAIASCERSDSYDSQIIVVNDGSTDGTPRTLDELAAGDQRITVIHRENGGLAAARNSGLAHLAGEYVVLLDADDELSPGWLAIAITVLQVDVGLDGVYGRYYQRYADRTGETAPASTPEKLDLITLLNVNLVPVNAFVLRAELYKKIGSFDTTLPTHEDWNYWLRAACATWQVKQLDSNACIVHVHELNMTHNQARMSAGRLACLSYVRRHCNLSNTELQHLNGRWAREVFFARLERVFLDKRGEVHAAAALRDLLQPLAALPLFYRPSPFFGLVRAYLVCMLIVVRLSPIRHWASQTKVRRALQPIRNRSPLALPYSHTQS